ncbi:MAG: hypothetical protein QM752_06450 [Gammaproteobacteria bacterium]
MQNYVDSRSEVTNWSTYLCRKFLAQALKTTKYKGKYSEELIDQIASFILHSVHFNQAELITQLCKNAHFIRHLQKMEPLKYNEYYDKVVKLRFDFLASLNIKDIFDYAISEDACETLKPLTSGWKISKKHIALAIECHSERSLAYLLQNITLSTTDQIELANRAKALGNITMLNLLHPEDSLFYFSEMIEKLKNHQDFSPSEVADWVYKAYSNSQLGAVDELCVEFVAYLKKEFPNNKQAIQIHHDIFQTRQEAIKVLSQLAQYRHPVDRHKLKDTYYQHLDRTEKTRGLALFKTIEEICKTDDLKIAAHSLALPICDPPSSPLVSMRDIFAHLIKSHQNMLSSQGHDSPIYFKNISEIRSYSSVTPCRIVSQYDHAFHFIDVVANFSCEDLTHTSAETALGEVLTNNLLYKGKLMSQTYMCYRQEQWEWYWRWDHGLGSLTRFWSDLERLNTTIGKMDPKETKPQEFYDAVTEMVWLIGQLTPTNRGTGTRAQQCLALTHKYFKLDTPLKLIPGLQLDCCTLSFPLSTYKKIFLHLFEFNSLPVPAQEYVRHRYHSDPALQQLLKQLKLAPPPLLTFDPRLLDPSLEKSVMEQSTVEPVPEVEETSISKKI